MVNKLWCRELTRRWFQTKFVSPHARCFSQPKCQDRLCFWYLVYRWLIFAVWLSIVINSFIGTGTYNGHQIYAYEKWPIYLTNWDLVLGLSQSLLGVILVTRRWRYQRKPDFDPDQLVYGKLERAYWFLYVATSSVAICVTIIYWGLVHNPSMEVSVTDVLIHVFNSVLMLIDFVVAGVPFELRCFWWAPLVGTLYLMFSVVYYLAGGLDRRGFHYIYDILNWDRPGSTLLVCAGSIILLVVTHCLLHLLTRFKDFAYGRKREPITPTPHNVESRV